MEMIKDEMENMLDDLDKLNDLYNKDYITIEEWNNIKNRIIDSMMEKLSNQKSND